MPTGEEAFKVIRSLDLAFKIEMVLYKLYSLIWWVSLSELGIFLFLFIIFLDEPMEMQIIFLHILHVPRAIVGFIILKHLP